MKIKIEFFDISFPIPYCHLEIHKDCLCDSLVQHHNPLSIWWTCWLSSALSSFVTTNARCNHSWLYLEKASQVHHLDFHHLLLTQPRGPYNSALQGQGKSDPKPLKFAFWRVFILKRFSMYCHFHIICVLKRGKNNRGWMGYENTRDIDRNRPDGL